MKYFAIVGIKTPPAVVAMGAPPHAQVEYSCSGGSTMCANRVFVPVVEDIMSAVSFNVFL